MLSRVWYSAPFRDFHSRLGSVAIFAACILNSGCSEDPPAGTAKSASAVPDMRQTQRAAAMAALREVDSPVAVTDKGRRVRLLNMPEKALPSSMLDEMEAEMSQEWGVSMRLIRTKPPDRSADCHGWIFAQAKWWMMGIDVELILQDNGYKTVTDPAPGDLVLYRSPMNPITHSGLVYAVNGDQVMVESKWSWLGCYVHAADTQPYGG